MAECIQAQITANLKTTLEGIVAGAGYKTVVEKVEERRSELDVDDDNYILLHEDEPLYEDDFQHTGDVKFRYTIIYFSGLNDLGSNNPFAYQNRNAAADIIKAVMADRTRDSLALNTITEYLGPGFWSSDDNMLVIPVTMVQIHVHALIDPDNPYSLGY